MIPLNIEISRPDEFFDMIDDVLTLRVRQLRIQWNGNDLLC